MNINNKFSIIIIIFIVLLIKLNYGFTIKKSNSNKLLLRCKKKCQNKNIKLKKFCKKCPSFESKELTNVLSSEKPLNQNNNNNIKHFVIIRFYSDNMMEKEIMFDYLFLHNAINDFKKFTLKSLENQSNKNFEVIIKINNDLPEDNKAISELKHIQSSININVIRSNLTDKYIIDNTNKAKFVITTRIDHDDLIYNDAVKDIQNKCNVNIPLYYNGYNNGITMINDNIKDCYKFNGSYKRGSISIFQSLIINKNLYKDYLNIYSLGPHNNQIDKFIKFYKGFVYNKSYFNINKLENSFVYVKHNFNHSSHYKFKKNWHRSKVKVEKDKDWFIKRFGNFINN